MGDTAQNMKNGDAEATNDELRVAPRFALLLRTAKLIGEAGEYLCVVRDVSASGISVRTFHPLPQGQLTLELPDGERHPIERVWEKDGAAGFRFAAEVDVVRLVEGKGRFPKRGVRLHLNLPASLSSLGGTHNATIRNLSQQGARVESLQRFALDQKVRLEARGLPAIRAVIRWRRDDQYGLTFDDTFQFGELARIAAELQGLCRTEFATGEQLHRDLSS